MTLKTRQPTGKVPWPLILVEGGEKSGKSWAAAVLSASPRVGRTVWIDLGEGAGDEYAAIPGTRYEIVEHDGSWRGILGAVQDARDEARRAADAGEPPFVLVIDGMTLIWDMLKDWATNRARKAPSNRKLLEADPNAEINVSSNFWNDANTRHRKLMTLLMTFPGIAVVTARGKDVTAMTNGQPDPKKPRDYRVEGHKDLGFDATVWVRLARDAKPIVVGARSVHTGVRPGVDKPQVLADDWSLEWLIFEALKCDPSGAQVRDLVELEPGSAGPDGDAASELAAQIAAASNKDELTAAWNAFRAAAQAGQLAPGMGDQLKAAWQQRRDEILPLADDDPRMKRMFALLGKASIVDRDERLRWYGDVLEREVSSTKELSGADVAKVTERTERFLRQQEPAEVGA